MKVKILQIALPFIWFGAVGAISFMEAPLKFRAPGITLPLGLGIGYLVFHALNKVELVLCLLIAATFIRTRPGGRSTIVIYLIITAILLAQTLWLFPLLDERTMQVIGGTAEPFSNLHIIYIVLDSTKILLLLLFGFMAARNHLTVNKSGRSDS